jgi:hypothetical protein
MLGVEQFRARSTRSGNAGLGFQKGNLRSAARSDIYPFKVADPRTLLLATVGRCCAGRSGPSAPSLRYAPPLRMVGLADRLASAMVATRFPFG